MTASSIACLSVLIGGDCTLLLPQHYIAEVLPVSPVVPLPDSEEWILGMFSWRSHAIPVISMEVLLEQQQEAISSVYDFQALLIAKAITSKLEEPYYAFYSHAVPSIMSVTNDSINNESSANAQTSISAVVEIEDASYVIPDLTNIEYRISHSIVVR